MNTSCIFCYDSHP